MPELAPVTTAVGGGDDEIAAKEKLTQKSGNSPGRCIRKGFGASDCRKSSCCARAKVTLNNCLQPAGDIPRRTSGGTNPLVRSGRSLPLCLAQCPPSCPGDAVGAAQDVEHVHQPGDVRIVSDEFGILVLDVPLFLYGVDEPVQPPMMKTEPFLDRIRDDACKRRCDGCGGQETSGHAPDQHGGDRCREETVPKASRPRSKRERGYGRILGQGGGKGRAEGHPAWSHLMPR